MTDQPRNVSHRISALEGIRAAAAVVVALGHLRMHGLLGSPEIPLPWFLRWITLGHLSVLIFFALSGYVLTANRSAIDFTQSWMRKRVRRLAPLYIVALLIPVAGDVALQRGLRSKGELLQSLLLLPAFGPRFATDPRNPPLWSLQVELLLSFLLWQWLRREKHLSTRRTLGLLLLTSVLALLSWSAQVPLLEAVPYFLLGVFMAQWHPVVSAKARSWTLGICIVSGLLAAGWYAAAQTTRPGFIAAFPWVLMLLLFGVNAQPSSASARVLEVLGRRTYALYAVHWPVILAANTLLPSPSIERTLGAVCAIALATESAYRLVDAPAITWSRRLRHTCAGAGAE